MAAEVTTIGPARQEALAALARVRRGMPVSDAILQTRRLKGVDRALMTQLVYGVVRHQRYLDAWIRPWRRGPLDPDITDILRLAFFQLGFLDRVPAYAVVNAAVEQAKSLKPQAANLVNAILRRGQAAPPQDLTLGEQYSHPDWLVDRWAVRWGGRVESILQADNVVPPLTVRVNLNRASREDILQQLRDASIQAEPSRYLPEAIRITGSVWLEELPAFQQGILTVQDESGMIVSWVLDPKPGDRIIDMAVGVGGKAIHALERAHGSLHLTGLDIAEQRLTLFHENLRRTGYEEHATLVKMPAERYALQHQGAYDRVILDAPCSGLGVLRRRVDARWKKKAEDFPALSARQQELLDAAWRLARPGGVIVYSTCSTEPEETQAVLKAAQMQRPDLRLEDVGPFLPHPDLANYVQDQALVLAPGDLGMDGFFIARLRVGGSPV